ncbi:MAG: glycosyltransferase family 2 protein [bacterium]|nr:glycosyltransferase family 2 protein [bacterium]
MSTAALVPAFDAAGSIADVVRGAAEVLTPVVVVDDGSADDTAARAQAAGAVVVRQPVNRGKGAALVVGLRYMAEHGITHALTLDADGQHLPSQLPVLLAASAAAPDAIVVGVRKKEGHTIRGINRFGNRVADTLMRRIAGRPLPDTQSGFRVYPVASTLALGTEGTRYEFETEVLLRAARAAMPLVGIPVEVFYPPVDERISHYRPWRDTLRIIGIVLRVLAAGRR